MPIPFTCPYCGLYTLVEDEFAGLTGPCASCGKTVVVPLAASAPSPRPASRPKSSKLTIIVAVSASLLGCILLISIAAAIFAPAVEMARSAQHTQACRDNLRRIGEALNQYAATHGTYPPAYIADAKGKPMHSWRVLILPFLGQQTLFDEYSMSEPWDGPQNSLLHAKMPEVFACPEDADGRILCETSYFVVTGLGTMFPGPNAQAPGAVRDDPAQTILVIESSTTGVGWLEPKELDVRQLQFSLVGSSGRHVGGNHDGGAQALMVDGTVQFLRETTAEDYLQAMATIAGQELIPWEVLDQ